MATVPQYASTPKNGAVNMATANTDRSGATTAGMVVVATAGTNGSRVDDVYITATATTTAGVVRLFLYNGTTAFMLQELLVTAITPSTTVPVWNSLITNMGLVLQSGWSLRATTNNAESFNVCVTRMGDL